MCPICGSADNHRVLYSFEPARSIPGGVVRCSSCRTIYRDLSDLPRPLAEYYSQPYAEAFQREIEDPEHMAGTIHAFNSILAVMLKSLGPTPLTLLDIVVTMLDLIEHLPDPVSALRRCRELLKPGGHLVVYTPNHASLIVRVADLIHRLSLGKISGPVAEIFDCTHVVFFDEKSLGLALTEAGYSIDRAEHMKYDPARTGQATGIAALGLRGIEAVSPLIRGQFRLLTLARS